MAYTHPVEHRMAVPAFSAPSILAIICAIASFFFGAGLGMVLAIAAIVLGAIGLMLSFSPTVRGGMTSTISVVAGVVGIVAAIFKLLL